MKWFPWHPLEHRRDTYKLSLAEDGAYRRLIDEYMVNRESLPDDDAALARILGVGLKDWLAVSINVRPFFKSQNGRLVHKRCDCELRLQDQRAERYSERGKKAAFAKYSRPNDLNARRMLVPATRHNITRHNTINSSGTSQFEQASAQRMGEGKSLAEIIQHKGWANGAASPTK